LPRRFAHGLCLLFGPPLGERGSRILAPFFVPGVCGEDGFRVGIQSGVCPGLSFHCRAKFPKVQDGRSKPYSQWKTILTFKCCVFYPQFKNGGGLMQAYCVKCRKKVDIKNPKSITMKNKRPATQGECPSCGTKVFRIGKS